MATNNNGNCYLCSETLGKTAMKNHLLKKHGASDAGQKCYLLKVEGSYEDYWLYLDVPVTASFSTLDTFLRKIWLECCGHMSSFFNPDNMMYRSEIGKSRKWETLAVGEKIGYQYDYGSTTTMLVTVAGETIRTAQKSVVRLLARNVPPVFQCTVCGKSASLVCTAYPFDSDNQFLCDSCFDENEDEYMLPITNSPRTGICAYDGGLDVFEFKPLHGGS